MEEAGGADERFKLWEGRFGHGRGSGEALEEFWRDHVDANVRALRGEDRCYQQLPRRCVGEGALDGGVSFVEVFEDGCDAVGGKVAAECGTWFSGRGLLR